MSNNICEKAALTSCKGCSVWNRGLLEVEEVLAGNWSACNECRRNEVIRAVSEQHRAGQPRWWLVNNVLAVPIWIVERVARCVPRSLLRDFS